MKGYIGSFVLTMSIALMVVSAPYAAFRAYVDKTTISAGASLTLTLEYEGQTNDEPELAQLERDFSVLSRQTSQESSYVNGKREAKTRWIFEIMPKSSAKSLTIPPVKLGPQRSDPIAIAQTGEASLPGESGISVVMTADRPTVYRNGELIVSLVIKTAMPLRNASLTKPEVKDAIIEPLQEGERTEVVENGIKYFIFKQRHAIYPSKPGTFTIPPVVFRGVAASGPGRGHGFGGLFATGSSVSARSNELSVTVKDVPASFPQGQQFLPLKSFAVIEAFDEANPQFEVSKATSRRFEMRARGALASFLPTIAAPSVKDLQIYAEAGTKVQKNEPDGMLATSKFSHIYMPTAPGHLLVPEQTIYWWDVDEDKLKTTVIRALDLNVLGDAIAPTTHEPPAQALQPVVPKAQGPDAVQEAPKLVVEKDYFWPLVAYALLILWFATIACWWWVHNRAARKKAGERREKTIEEELKERIKSAAELCSTNDPKQVYSAAKALLMWADRDEIESVRRLALMQEVKALEASLYSSNGGHVQERVTKVKAGLTSLCVRSSAPSPMAPLYPQ